MNNCKMERSKAQRPATCRHRPPSCGVLKVRCGTFPESRDYFGITNTPFSFYANMLEFCRILSDFWKTFCHSNTNVMNCPSNKSCSKTGSNASPGKRNPARGTQQCRSRWQQWRPRRWAGCWPWRPPQRIRGGDTQAGRGLWGRAGAGG